MSNFTYENQGIKTYLTYTLENDAQLDQMCLAMLTNNNISGLAQTIFSQIDQKKIIHFNVSSKVPADQFLLGDVNKAKLLCVLRGIINAISVAEDYMLDPSMIILDLRFIFVDVSTTETSLICLPIQGYASCSINDFLKQLMNDLEFDQSENCDYVAKIMMFIKRNANATPADFVCLLDELQKQSPTVQSVVAPQAPAAPITPPPTQPKPSVPWSSPAPQQSAVVQQPVVAPQQPVVQQPVVQQPVVQQPAAPASFAVPQQTIAQPVKVKKAKAEPKQSDEKQMSLFYLLNHYNKDNVAIYKAQKKKQEAEPKVSKKEAKKKSANPSFPIPGQATPPIANAVTSATSSTVPNPATPSVQQMTTPQPIVQPVQPVVAPQPIAQPVQPMATPAPMPQYPTAAGETTVLNAQGAAGDTTILGAAGTTLGAMPYLIRMQTQERINITKAFFRIGREVNYVDYNTYYNTAIGKSHANIVLRNGQAFIVDNASRNHTFINDNQIPPNVECPVKHGDRVCFANEVFTFYLY